MEWKERGCKGGRGRERERREKDRRVRVRKRVKEREKKTAFEKKYLRIKFQDSLCAIQKDEVYQQSAKGILREEIDFFFLPPGGEKKNNKGEGE